MPLIILLFLFSATFFSPVVADLPPISPIQNAEGETIILSYRPEEMAIDENAESILFELVNEERRKVGLSLLEWDEGISAVARKHSHDMWERQYFAHDNLDSETPVDRLEEGELLFSRAGENLALTRTVERAHNGLMNSPGHRRNILDPGFKRIGIGVVDGGIYGKMFTQNFTD